MLSFELRLSSSVSTELLLLLVMRRSLVPVLRRRRRRLVPSSLLLLLLVLLMVLRRFLVPLSGRRRLVPRLLGGRLVVVRGLLVARLLMLRRLVVAGLVVVGLLVLRSLLLVPRVGVRLVRHSSPRSLLISLTETGASRHLSGEKVFSHVEILSPRHMDVVGSEHSWREGEKKRFQVSLASTRRALENVKRRRTLEATGGNSSLNGRFGERKIWLSQKAKRERKGEKERETNSVVVGMSNGRGVANPSVISRSNFGPDR